MPNYYAHQKFGGMVLRELPGRLMLELSRERSAFNVGCLGPDPLFFSLRPQVRREGFAMHRDSALPVFSRLREAAEEGTPLSKGYAAGFLCHLALDSGCHGYIGGYEASHLAIEAEFDRMLMEEDGLSVKGVTHMSAPSGGMVWAAAARAFETANAAAFRSAYQSMRRDTLLLAKACGTRLKNGVDRLAGRISVLNGAKGVILGEEPSPAFAESSRVLSHLMDGLVQTAAGQIEAFCTAVANGAPLDRWLDRTFGGEPEEEPCEIARAVSL